MPPSVKEIGNEAFDCILISLTIPSSVERIGREAFDSYHIRNVTYLSDSPLSCNENIFNQNAFENATLSIPEGTMDNFIATSPWNLFKNIIEIGGEDNSFKLKYQYFDEGKASVSGYEGNPVNVIVPKEIEREDGERYVVTSIQARAFQDCKSLKTVTLPEGLIDIEGYAFHNCTSLLKVDLSKSLETISDGAFYGCSSLEEIDLPTSLKTIWFSAFRDCSSIKEVVLPKTLNKLGGYVFSGCTSLSLVVFPDTLEILEGKVFENCPLKRICYNATTPVEGRPYVFDNTTYITCILEIPEAGKTNFMHTMPWCYFFSQEIEDDIYYTYQYDQAEVYTYNRNKGLEIIEIPSFIEDQTGQTFPVTSIGKYAFEDAPSLKKITLPDTLDRIKELSFCGCKDLSVVNLPNSLSVIEYGTFIDCVSLKEIILPKSLVHIGQFVFSGCDLEKITYLSTQPITTSIDVFSSDVYSSATLEIPKGSREVFMTTTPWNLFKNIAEIEENDPDPVPSEDYHLLTVSITNGFTAKLRVNHGEKAVVALELDEWWEPEEVKFNGAPLDITEAEIQTPEMIQHSTLEITPRFKGEVNILDATTGIDAIESNGVEVMIKNSSTVLVKGLMENDEITIYSEAGHIIRTITATFPTITIENLVPGCVYFIRINNQATKLIL